MPIIKTDADISLIRNSLGLNYSAAKTLADKNPDRTAAQIISDAKLKQRNSSPTNHILNTKPKAN